MATFKKTLSGDDRYYIELEVKEVTGSVSIEDNTSDVSYKLTATKKSGSGYYSNSAVNTVKVTIDGQDIVNKKMSYDFTGSTPKTITLASGTLNNIEHNTDGTKSLSCKGYFKDGANSLGSGTASGSLTLSPIPRASSISVSGDIILGSPITIQISRASSDFLHELRYSFGNIENIFIASDIAESYQWTPPLNLAQQIPNADRGVMTITCFTYKASDSSSIGSKTLQQYAYVPNTLTPSISVSNPTISGDAPASWGLFVKGKSTATYTITGTGVQESTISSYQSSVDGYTYTTANVTTNTLMTAGSNTINAKVIDSRGKQASTTKTINVVDYSNPTISTAQVQRCDVNGNIDNNGDYCYVSFSGSVTSLNSHNSGVSAYLIRYKTHDAQSYVNSVPVAAFVQSYSGTGMLYTDGIYPANRGSGTKLQLPSTNTYDIQFAVEDYFTEATNTQTLDTGFDLLNFNPSGKSMAIGKVSEASENEELLEVALDTEFSGTVTGETINFTSSNALDTLYGYISSILIGLFNSLGSSDALWDNLPKTTETGTNIELNNSIEAPVRIKLNASETTQNTTTGKNLLGLTNVSSTTTYGITYSVNNNVITLSGTANNTGSTAVLIDIPLLTTMPTSLGTLTKSLNRSGTYTGVQTSLRGSNPNSSAGLWSNNGENNVGNTLTQDAYYFRIQINNNVSVNCTLKAQVETGSSVSSFEPYTYGASPNPNYPQPIETTTGRNTIDVCGKNLFNKNKGIVVGKSYSSDGSIVNLTETFIQETYIQVESNTKYTLSTTNNYVGTTNYRLVFMEYSSDKTFIQRTLDYTHTYNTITTTSNTKYIRICASNVAINDLQLEKGSSSSTYEPYIGNSYEVNLGKNLFDKDNANILNGWMDNNTQMYLQTSQNNRILYISCQPNTTYTISRSILTTTFRVATYDSTPIPTTTSTGTKYVINGLIKNNNATSITITTDANAKYLLVHYGNIVNDTNINESLASIQIEKGSQATEYVPYFEPIELCKIGDYQDYIYKENGNWYKYNAIGKVVLNGSESWVSQSYGTNSWALNNVISVNYNANEIQVMSRKFKGVEQVNRNTNDSVIYTTSNNQVYIRNTPYTTLAQVQSGMSNEPLYYVLATSTYTQITNSELINQLEDLKNAHSYNKITNIMQENSELPFILEVDVIDLQNLT